jgi:Mrp family chromosome partitioning ATPase/capsular polysaccharide biosynthesis protein
MELPVRTDVQAPIPAAESSEGGLTAYLRAIRTHRVLVVLVTLAALAGSIVWLSLRTAEYKATAQILVTPVPQDGTTLPGIQVLRSDANESTRTVQTAAALVDSPAAARLTAQHLGHGWTRRKVLDAIEVKPQGESNVLAVTAKADGGATAARVANEFVRATLTVRKAMLVRQANAAIAQLKVRAARGASGDSADVIAEQLNQLQAIQRTGDPTLSLSQPADVPTSPAGAAPWLLIALSLLAGLTVGSGGAVLLELIGPRVRDEEELRELYPLPVLGYVPKIGRRLRRSNLRSIRETPPAVREAFRSVQVQLDRTGERPRAIMLTSASTGDGKTTSAVNLAVALVGAGHRVVLADLDLRKPDVGKFLSVEPKRRLVSLLSPETKLSDVLVQPPEIPPLRVLLAASEGEAVLLDALGRRLPELLAEAREVADYVIIDTAPLGEVSDALRALDLVDDIIIVARPGNTNRVNFELMRDLLQRANRSPTGYVVIGDQAGRSSSYYAYGLAARQERARHGVLARLGR